MAFRKGAESCKKSETLEFFGDGINEPTNWKKGAIIGRGAFGKVFKASITTPHSGEIHLAVKEVAVLLQEDRLKHEESVKKELVALKKLRHERIIKYYGFHATKESFFIFIELMKNGSLEQFINDKYSSGEGIDESLASTITKEIIEGVVYLHENNMFHRDLKSANVLMTDEYHVKLADFGLTREFAEISKTYTNGVGTSRFMAPEMVALKDDGSYYKYNNSVDIWAVGCIVVHMLTGKVPHANLEEPQVIYKLGQSDPSPAKGIISDVSKNCRRFLKKTLVKNVNARATAVSLLRESFITGNNLTEFETDAGIEEQEAHVQEFDVRGDLKLQPPSNHIIKYPQLTQYIFQGDVNFNKDFHADNIDLLKVEKIEKFLTDRVENVELQQAEAILAQVSDFTVGNADTVLTRKAEQINFTEVKKIMLNQTDNVSVRRADYVIIDGDLRVNEKKETLV